MSSDPIRNSINDSAIKSNFRLANKYWNSGDIDKYKVVMREIGQSVNRYSGSFNIKYLEYQGDYYSHQKIGKSDSALIYFQKAELLSKNYDNHIFYNLLLKKAMILHKLDDNYQAQLLIYKAFSYFKKSNNRAKCCVCHLELGYIFCKQKNFIRANKEFEKAKNYAHDNLTLAHIYNNIARTQIEMGNYYKAIDNIRAIRMLPFDLKEDPTLNIIIEENYVIANSFLSPNRIADKSFISVIKKCDSVKFDQAPARISYADYCRRIGQKQNAVKILKQALAISDNQLDKISAIENLLFLLNSDNSLIIEYLRLTDISKRKNWAIGNSYAQSDFTKEEKIYDQSKEIQRINLKVLLLSLIASLSIIVILLYLNGIKRRNLTLINQNHSIQQDAFKLLLREQDRLRMVRNDERDRISKELHDGVMNRLTSIRLKFSNVQNHEFEQNPLSKFIAEIQMIEKEIRNVSHDLSNSLNISIDNYNQLLQDLISSYNAISNFRIDYFFDENVEWSECSTELKINLYRVLQELFSNAQKHSFSDFINVNIIKDNKDLKVEIIDSGSNFKNAQSSGIGLKNVRERINKVNGTIQFFSLPSGSRITINIKNI